MMKKVLIGLGAVIVLFLGVVAMQPAEFKLERQGTVEAPADVAFGMVNDFKAWRQWSPWDKLDANQKVAYEGPEMGVGAITTWEGNDDVGKGKMTIKDVKPNELITIDLEFIAPFEAQNVTTFAFAPGGTPEAPSTQVTWTMTGTNNFMSKAFGLFVNMDEMVGKDFEAGLAALNTAAKAEHDKRKAAALAQAAAAAPVDPAAAVAPATPAK